MVSTYSSSTSRNGIALQPCMETRDLVSKVRERETTSTDDDIAAEFDEVMDG